MICPSVQWICRSRRGSLVQRPCMCRTARKCAVARDSHRMTRCLGCSGGTVAPLGVVRLQPFVLLMSCTCRRTFHSTALSDRSHCFSTRPVTRSEPKNRRSLRDSPLPTVVPRTPTSRPSNARATVDRSFPNPPLFNAGTVDSIKL